MKKSILIAEDAPEVLALLRAILQADGWTVHTARDGDEACEVLRRQDIRLVITDWMMPGMDGLALIEWIRDRFRRHYVYTILMTARGSEEDSIQGLECGADDYLVKPVSAGLLRARLQVAQRILKMQRKLANEQEKLRKAHRLLSESYRSTRMEIDDAMLQQLGSLPLNVELPPGVTAEWRFQPATSLSGDHLHFFMHDDDRLVFYLLDVSGHGLSAALRSVAMSELLHPSTWVMEELTQGPHRVMERLNRHVCGVNGDAEHLATLVLGVLDTRSGTLNVCSAGHPCPLIIGPDGPVGEIECRGLPLGVMPEIRYETQTCRLEPGHSLLLYSDGVTDCLDANAESFGYERLRALLSGIDSNRPDDMIRMIGQRLEKWRGEVPFQDDSTLLSIGLEPRLEPEARPQPVQESPR